MAIATEPTKWIRPLGESADINAIADEYKGENSISFKELFPPITQLPLSAGGVCPDRKDTNALFKVLGDYIWYAQHGGIPAYSADFDYHVGALVSYNNKCYICIVANGAGTTVKTPTDTSAWSLVPSMEDISASVNAYSATKLQTARTIALSGGATGTATSFNGTANITIPVTAVDGSKVTGTVPAATKATQDGSGNTITTKYVTLDTTQTISGTKTFSAVTKSATPSASATGTEVVTAAWLRSRMAELLPAGTIVPFAGSNIPSGFLLCNGAKVSRTTYATLFSAIGTTWGSGDGSTTFTLPDARDRFLEGANTSAVGKYLSAGLPNITGTFKTANENDNNISGAFYKIGVEATGYGSGTQGRIIGFSAQNSNSIYNSNTVQPKALSVNFIIKY